MIDVSGPQLKRYGASAGARQRVLAGHGYVNFINLVRRNADADAFKPGRLRDLRVFGPMLTDVFAIPPGGKTLPRQGNQLPARTKLGKLC